MFNKKGQSLVEVVVAMSILIIILTGVVTLIVNVMNLTMMARNSLSATALAQKVLVQESSKYLNTCSVVENANSGILTDSASGFSYEVKKMSPDSTIDSGFSADRFIKIIVDVTFKNKGYGEQIVSTSQIIRTNQ